MSAFLAKLGLGLGAALAVFNPPPLLACATCFGQSDAPLAKGMNMGILSLLVVVVLMWAGLIAFFVHLARRSAAAAESLPSSPMAAALPQTNPKV